MLKDALRTLIAYSVERIAYRKKYTNLLFAKRYPLNAKTSAIVFLITALFTCTAHAEEAKPKAPIVVNGDKVEYFHEQKKVVGTGNVSIDYEDVKLPCKQFTCFLDT